jgi:hypothetical protein
MGDTSTRRAVIRIDYGNQSEMWWQALWQRLESNPHNVPEAVRRLTQPSGGDAVSVSPAEARAVQAWAASLPGWAGGPRHAPYPLRIEGTR